MNKSKLYELLLIAYNNNSKKNTLCSTYTDNVIKLVKQYLKEREQNEKSCER